MRRFVTLVVAGVLCFAGTAPVSPVAAALPSKAQCEKAWYEWQYFSIAPGFPVTLPPRERNRLVKACRKVGRLPDQRAMLRLTQKAYNVTAQIVEREVRRVSIDRGITPCEAAHEVLKPVGAHGKPLGGEGGNDVEGYAADSFLPILKYNWYGGPFRLKWGTACLQGEVRSLWFISQPYTQPPGHPDRYPTDAEVEADPWSRSPVDGTDGSISTCIAWGPGLGNEGVGGAGLIFSIRWFPMGFEGQCLARATNTDGLGDWPYKVVPNLPL